MKKSLLLVGLMALALTACKVGEKPADKKDAAAPAATAPAKDAAAPAKDAPPAAKDAAAPAADAKDAAAAAKTLQKTPKMQLKMLALLPRTQQLLQKTLPRNNSCSV